MKKIIPLMCMSIMTFSALSCTDRDTVEVSHEQFSTVKKEKINIQSHCLKDSVDSEKDKDLVPDPPVKDGDDWRTSL